MEEKYFCRTCKGLRNHKELYKKQIRGSEGNWLDWINSYCVIECLGCETVSFLKVYGDTSMVYEDNAGKPEYYYDVEVFPKYLEEGRELSNLYLLPNIIKNIYTETISALKSNSDILAAGGLRAIIEATCNHLKIEKGSLEVRINLLYTKGYLTLNESRRIHAIRFIGNDALHEIARPKKEDLYILLEIVNHLLANLFINDKIIKGKEFTIIDKYDDYLILIRRKITEELLGQEITIKKLIGKSVRLITKDNHIIFERLFKEEIRNNKHDFICIVDDNKETVYRIEKDPLELPF